MRLTAQAWVRVWLVIVAANLVPAAASTQAVPRDDQPASGTPQTAAPRTPTVSRGTVRGRITNAAGEPIRRASVRLMITLPTPLADGTKALPQATTTADQQGRYEFKDVPAGEYHIRAGKPGYLPLEYGQQRSYEPGRAFVVAAGRIVEGIDLVLPTTAVIEGHVTDQAGDPVEAVDVRLMRLQFSGNRPQLVPAAGVGARTTNDRGEYRLYGAPPGQYVIVASIVPDARRQAGFGLDPSTPILPVGYSTTYYPGAADPSQARTFTIGSGEERTAVDFSLARPTTSRVTGRVLGAQGQPIRSSVILAASQRSGRLGGEPLIADMGADATFTFPAVPPGDWVLQAVGPTRGAREGEFAMQYLTIAGVDISDIVLRTAPGSTMAGHVVLEGTTPGNASGASGVQVTTLMTDYDLAPRNASPGTASVASDLSFELDNLTGPRRVVVKPPAGWFLRAVLGDGRDVTDEILEFAAPRQSLADVVVVLSDRPTRVTGSVRNERGDAIDRYTVIVFSPDPAHWYQESRYLTFTRANADGTFALTGLPPSDYLVAAIDRMDGTDAYGEWQDPDVLSSFLSRASPLTLLEGQTVTVPLRLIVR